jgi:hypothetical protein
MSGSAIDRVRTEQGWRLASRRWIELFARP